MYTPTLTLILTLTLAPTLALTLTLTHTPAFTHTHTLTLTLTLAKRAKDAAQRLVQEAQALTAAAAAAAAAAEAQVVADAWARRKNPWRRRGHERRVWQQAQRGTPRAGLQSSTNGSYTYGARLSRQRRQRPQKKAAERMDGQQEAATIGLLGRPSGPRYRPHATTVLMLCVIGLSKHFLAVVNFAPSQWG